MQSSQIPPKYIVLFESIKKDDDGKVNALLRDGLDINYQSMVHDGNTPLFYAMLKNKYNIVKLLLQKGANPNIPGSRSRLPLMFACKKGDEKLLELLLDPENPIKTEFDYTSHGVNNTPLCLAIGKRFTAIVRRLLQAGANPDLSNKSGASPLHIAVRLGYLEGARELINKGADLNKLDEEYHETPLLSAIDKKQVELARLLLQHKAEINVVTSDGHTPISLAIQRNNAAMVELLLNFHAKADDYTFDRVPLIIAAFHKKNNAMIIALVNHGADIHAVDKDGETLLIHAIRNKNILLVRYCLLHHASLYASSKQGSNPLEMAIMQNDSRIVDVILTMIINSKIKDYPFNPESLLLLAFMHAEDNIIKLLLNFAIKAGTITKETKQEILRNAARYKNFTAFVSIYCRINAVSERDQEKNIFKMIMAYFNFLIEYEFDVSIIIRALPSMLVAEHKLSIVRELCDKNHELALELVNESADSNKRMHTHKSNKENLRSVQQIVDQQLMSAVRNRKYDSAENALNNGADVAAEDKHGDSLLHIAVKMNDYPLVSLLLKNHARVNRHNIVNESPVYLAARFGYLDILKLLVIDYKADIQKTCFETEASLLDLPAAKLATIKKYIAANPSASGYRFTPLEIAETMGEMSCVVFLRSYIEMQKVTYKSSSFMMFGGKQPEVAESAILRGSEVRKAL